MKGIKGMIAAGVIGVTALVGVVPAGAAPGKPPKPKGTLEAVVPAFEEAVASGDCAELAEFLLHTSLRDSSNGPAEPVGPDSPPTDGECAYVEDIRANVLAGFEATDTVQWGPAGIVEGTGDFAEPVDTEVGVVATVWTIDIDGRFRVALSWAADAQIGAEPNPGLDYDEAAATWTKAVQDGECETVYDYYAVDSVRITKDGATLSVGDYCEAFVDALAPDAGPNQLVSIAESPKSKPKLLGATLDIGLYGLETQDGRYQTLVVTSNATNFDAEGHNDPSIYITMTNRRPKD